MRYQMTPGSASAASSETQGSGSPGVAATNRYTLVLFLHPQCGCSRATVEELDQLMTHCRDRLHVAVYVLQPSQESEAWSRTSLWSGAAAIPGVEVHADRDGIFADRFGARTSGEAFVYDATGQLRFAGGITGSRGHAGDNAGLAAVMELVQQPTHAPVSVVRTPVFGCALKGNSPRRS